MTNEDEHDIIDINQNLLNNKLNPEFSRTTLYIIGHNKYKNICDDNQINFIEFTSEHKKYDDQYNNYSNISIENIDRPGWAYNNYVIGSKYFENNNFRIFFMENLEHNWDVLEYFKPNDYLFIIIGSWAEKWNFEYANKIIRSKNPNFNLKNICWLANEIENILYAHEYGFSSIFCNQNAIIVNENIFDIINELKIYDHIINCRPEKNFKKPYLCKKVDNLAVIKGFNFRKYDFYDLTELNSVFINENRLNQQEVVKKLNQSKTGGIYSEKEGACFSSGEYLLCGLPVISLDARGGRQIWYNKDNSVICEMTEESVKSSVDDALNKLNNNEFNPIKIRENHINFAKSQRENLFNYMKHIYNKHEEQIDIDIESFVNSNPVQNVRKNYSSSDFINILKN